MVSDADEMLRALGLKSVDDLFADVPASVRAALDLAPDAHLLVRGDVPIPIDEPLEDGETIRVIAVVSGGLA